MESPEIAGRQVLAKQSPAGEKVITEKFEYVKFPYQTYRERGGDCEDLAVLFACLLQSININSCVILWSGASSGHSFVSFDGNQGQGVRIEQTYIGKQSYESAVRRGAEVWERARRGYWGSLRVRKAFDRGERSRRNNLSNFK